MTSVANETQPTSQTLETVPFTAGDGMQLNLIHARGGKSPTRGPILLVHGAGVRANLFRPPSGHTIVDMLLAEGYDVWLENGVPASTSPPIGGRSTRRRSTIIRTQSKRSCVKPAPTASRRSSIARARPAS